jgi:hypothetical protein
MFHCRSLLFVIAACIVRQKMPCPEGMAVRQGTHAAFHLMGDSVSDSVRDRRRPGRQQSLRRGRIVWFDYAMQMQTCQAFAATFPKDAQRLKNGTYCEKISQLVVIKTTGLGIEITEKILYIVHRKPASAGVGAGKVQICWKGNRNYGTDRLQIH